MKKLYIVRGLPGSGKSTYARKLAPLVIEPDMFRYDENNEYVFDSDRNAEVNRKAYRLCHYAMESLKMPVLAVTAAYIRIDKFRPYLAMARNHGYEVTVVECLDSFENVHNVPASVISKMGDAWDAFDANMAKQEGVSLWRVVRGERTVLYTPKGVA